jgi:hypothetical protein
VKIADAVHEFILYKQSLGMTYKNRALKLTAFARLAGPVNRQHKSGDGSPVP